MSNWVNWCDASLESDARYFYKDLFTKDIHVNNIDVRLRITGRAIVGVAQGRKDYSDWSKHQDELGAFKPSLVLVDAVSGKEIMREGEILKTVSADVAGWRKSKSHSRSLRLRPVPARHGLVAVVRSTNNVRRLADRNSLAP